MAAPLFSAARNTSSTQASIQARPSGVVNANELDVRLHPRQGRGHRIGAFGSALNDVYPQDGHVRAELEVETLAVLGRDDDDDLGHVVALQKPLGRVQPDGLARQGAKGFL